MTQRASGVRGVFVVPALLMLIVAAEVRAAEESAPPPAASDQPAQTGEATPEDPGAAIWAAASAAMQKGPAKVTLIDQAVLSVPEGFGFVPKKESVALMRMMGNQTDSRFQGLVFPLAQDAQWFVSIDYDDAGYVKDDEAAKWDAEELLQNLKDGTDAANEERIKAGIAPIKVTRWIEPPKYDAGIHRLVWSAEIKLRDGVDENPGVNYNTYILGREGYFEANLVTAAATVEGDKLSAQPVLEAIEFNDGRRYADFDSSTDKVAAYGLTALVAGVAAKKIGFFALAAAFIAKSAKVIIAAIAALVVAVRKFLGRKAPGTGTA